LLRPCMVCKPRLGGFWNSVVALADVVASALAHWLTLDFLIPDPRLIYASARWWRTSSISSLIDVLSLTPAVR
jgi:hypothetical protein